MSHLLPSSIKPHLRRSRSHTSPSPNRPTTLDITNASSNNNEPSRSVSGVTASSGGLGRTGHQDEAPVVDHVAPRAVSDSQKHSRIPHLHLHTHLPVIHNHHHMHKNSSESVSNAANGPGANLPVTQPSSSDLRPSTTLSVGKQSTLSSISGPTTPITGRGVHPQEPWGMMLSPTGPGGPSLLRRTLSHRSTSRQEGGAENNMFSPSAIEGNNPIGPGSSLGVETRPRAVSDSSRPGLRRENTISPYSADATSNAIALAIERGDQRRRANLLSATPADVAKRDREAAEAEEEMRQRLDAVTKEGMDITRRLDYTYYNLLERLGGLVAMVGQFQSLREQLLSLGTKLEHNMKSIDDEVSNNIKGLQEAAEGKRLERVEKLEQRMRDGRERANALGERLETARNRLREWEEQEQAWRARLGRRMRIAWAVVILVALLFLVILVMRAQPAIEESMARNEAENASWLPGHENESDHVDQSVLENRLRSVYIPDDVLHILTTDAKDGKSTSIEAAVPVTSSLSPSDSARSGKGDDRLRIFDEL